MYEDAGPVTRAMIGYDLSDAQEHLNQLRQEMVNDPEFGEVEFSIGLAHVYAHLNRAWNQRNASEEEMNDPNNSRWEEWGRFPTDLQPLA